MEFVNLRSCILFHEIHGQSIKCHVTSFNKGKEKRREKQKI